MYYITIIDGSDVELINHIIVQHQQQSNSSTVRNIFLTGELLHMINSEHSNVIALQ